MATPLFSCVVHVKGARPYLDAALASLQGQGLGDELEVIVQDGDVESDSGQSDALNKGFAKVRGEWLFWPNADDVLLPGALKKVQQLLTHKFPVPCYQFPHNSQLPPGSPGIRFTLTNRARPEMCAATRSGIRGCSGLPQWCRIRRSMFAASALRG